MKGIRFIFWSYLQYCMSTETYSTSFWSFLLIILTNLTKFGSRHINFRLCPFRQWLLYDMQLGRLAGSLICDKFYINIRLNGEKRSLLPGLSWISQYISSIILNALNHLILNLPPFFNQNNSAQYLVEKWWQILNCMV